MSEDVFDVQENSALTEDWFEKAFGKRPADGSYEFKYLGYQISWRSIYFRWSCTGVGFGEFVLLFTEKGIEIDNEQMSDEFTIALLNEAIKRIDDGQRAIVSKQMNIFQKAKCWIKWKLWKDNNSGYWLHANGGYKDAESDEGHEEFIKNVCLTFKHYAEEGMKIKKMLDETN